MTKTYNLNERAYNLVELLLGKTLELAPALIGNKRTYVDENKLAIVLMDPNEKTATVLPRTTRLGKLFRKTLDYITDIGVRK